MSYTKQEQSFLRKIGENIRASRIKRGWSQEELGFQSEVHRTYIGAIERGERNISILNLRKIALTLGVNLPAIVSITAHEEN
jgi:transcriptional regulator with XRE-family HTH domain